METSEIFESLEKFTRRLEEDFNETNTKHEEVKQLWDGINITKTGIIHNLIAQNKRKSKHIKSLQGKIEILEHLLCNDNYKSRTNNIEVYGEDDDVSGKNHEKVDVKVQSKDIEVCQRVPDQTSIHQNRTIKSANGRKLRNLNIKLQRDTIVYISNNLNTNETIHYHCLQLLKTKRISNYFSASGVITINHLGSYFKIIHMNDLLKIFPDESCMNVN